MYPLPANYGGLFRHCPKCGKEVMCIDNAEPLYSSHSGKPYFLLSDLACAKHGPMGTKQIAQDNW